jgi:hypothetical protein
MIDEKELIDEIDRLILQYTQRAGQSDGKIIAIREYSSLDNVDVLTRDKEMSLQARADFQILKNFVLQKGQAKKKTCHRSGCTQDRQDLSIYCPAHTQEYVKERTCTCVEKGCDREKATGGIYCKKHTEKITKPKKCAFPKCKVRVEPFSIYCTWHQDHDLD